MLVAHDFGTGQILWSMFWFFLFVIWLWMLFAVFGDVFRSGDLSGWAKAAWTIFIILVPYLGVFVYLIARGGKMSDNSRQAAQQRDAQMRDYVRDAAGTAKSPAEEVATLAGLRDSGAITEAEFQSAKAKALA